MSMARPEAQNVGVPPPASHWQDTMQKRVQQQHRTIIHLSTHPAVVEGHLHLALKVIVSAATQALNVTSAHVWRLSPDSELCHGLVTLEPGKETQVSHHVINMHAYPEYFAAIRSGLVLDIVNVRQDPRTQALTESYWKPRNITSSIEAPIRLHGQVTGIVRLEHSGPIRQWQADEITFASQIASLIGQVFLNADLHRRAAELAIITRISREIAAVHDLRQILNSIAGCAAEFSNADASGVFALKTNGDIVIAGHGVPDDFIQLMRHKAPLLLKKGLLAEAITAKRPKQITDLRLYPDKLSQYIVTQQNIQAVLCVPMFNENQITGGIVLGQYHPHCFSREEIAFIQALGQQSINAVENTRLFQAERRQREMAERLHQIALWVNGSLQLSEVLKRILDQLKHICPYESGTIQILEQDVMRIVATHSIPVNIPERTFALKDHPYNQKLANGETIIVRDFQYDMFGWVLYADSQPLRANIGVPLWVKERVIGALVINSRTPNAYTREDARIVQVFARQAAVAIQNAQLFAEQRSERELAEALAAAAAVVSSSLDQDQVLDHILEQVARVVKGDIFNVMMRDNDIGKIVRGRGYKNYGITYSEIDQFEVSIGAYPKLVEMTQTGEPVLVNDVSSDPNWVTSNPYRCYLRSYVAAPICIAENMVGFLNVNGTRAHQFTPQDAQRLKAFADHAAVAIQNARAYQKQRHYADKLEQEVRKRTIELEAKNAWLQAIQDSTADGIIVTDSDGTLVETNQVVKVWQTEVFSPADAEQFYATLRDMAHRASEQPETVLELSQLDLQLSAAPISSTGANIPGVVLAVHDVSYLKALDRMKSRFVSDVSHELRTPLTSIGLYIQLLQTRPAAQHRPYWAALEQETQRLTTLVEDILQISRIESGKMSLNKESVDLNRLLEMTVANHKILAESYGLGLTYDGTLIDTQLKIDPDKFSQVLNNLVRNAINYTTAGGHIQVRMAHQVRDSRSGIAISVQDTGMGIPENEVQYVFDRFFRGDGPRQLQIQGTGLGLAIVKEVVELHGGEITVESQVNVGSTFTVWVPIPVSDTA